MLSRTVDTSKCGGVGNLDNSKCQVSLDELVVELVVEPGSKKEATGRKVQVGKSIAGKMLNIEGQETG